MKYEQADRWFQIYIGKKVGTVIAQPVNGETDPAIDRLSWSHGFTHMRALDGKVFFCGQEYFEKNAVDVTAQVAAARNASRKPSP